jgi:hypothetical protein
MEQRYDRPIQHNDSGPTRQHHQPIISTCSLPTNLQYIDFTRRPRHSKPTLQRHINAYMTTTKRCLQYVHQGVWLGFNKPRPLLPAAITSLFQDWEVSTNRSWEIFRKYLPTFNEISVHEPSSPHDFVLKASLQGSKDKMKEYGAKRLRTKVLEDAQVTPEHVLRVLPSLLDKRTSMALMTMNRSNEANNRIKNNTFKTALQRKLRLPILDSHQDFICKCGVKLDAFGDHCLGCKVNHKGKASNGIRDEIAKIFQRILPTAKMIDSPTQIEKELHNIVPSLPQLKPFDLSIRLDHQLDTRCWQTPYTRIGFDVTLIHSTTNLPPPPLKQLYIMKQNCA